MAYMHADTKPKVGYRPYLQTNPRGAALLSGVQNITGLGQNHPFDPWRLHGMGQWRPFDQDPGGWHLHGLSGLDGVSGSAQAAALGAGMDPADLQSLITAGANDDDVLKVADGEVDLTTMLQELIAQAAAAAPGPASPWSNQQPEVPSGSKLIYAASWSNLAVLSESGVIGKMTSSLPQYGMSVDSSSPIEFLPSLGIGTTKIQLNITDHIGHARQTDAKSVLDALMQQFVGNTLTGSTLSVTAAPGTTAPSSALPPPAPDHLAWLEGNWVYLALAAVAVIATKPVMTGIFGKSR